MHRSRLLTVPAVFLSLAGALIFPVPAPGQQCLPQVVHHTELVYEESVFSGAVAGDVLYLAAYWRTPGLRVYDLSNPLEPALLPPYAIADARAVAAFESMLVVTTKDRILTLDVTDPAQPAPLGEHPLSEPGYGLAISDDGSTAWVGDEGAMVGVDISDPTSLRIVSTLPVSSIPSNIVLEGNIAYLIDGGGTSSVSVLRIINTSDPATPIEMGSLAIPNAFRSAALDGTLYVTTLGAGLRVIDVTDPSSPVEVASVEAPRFMTDVILAPPIALVLGGAWLSAVGEDLLTFDISEPGAPHLISTRRTRSDTAKYYAATDMFLRDGIVHIVENFDTYGRYWRLTTVDVSSCQCAADCDGSGELDVFDFLCFQNLFAAGDPAADCDGSGELDLFDFLCFQDVFAAGCSR